MILLVDVWISKTKGSIIVSWSNLRQQTDLEMILFLSSVSSICGSALLGCTLLGFPFRLWPASWRWSKIWVARSMSPLAIRIQCLTCARSKLKHTENSTMSIWPKPNPPQWASFPGTFPVEPRTPRRTDHNWSYRSNRHRSFRTDAGRAWARFHRRLRSRHGRSPRAKIDARVASPRAECRRG